MSTYPKSEIIFVSLPGIDQCCIATDWFATSILAILALGMDKGRIAGSPLLFVNTGNVAMQATGDMLPIPTSKYISTICNYVLCLQPIKYLCSLYLYLQQTTIYGVLC